MTTTTSRDIWDEVADYEPTRLIFGQIQADAYYCALIKGQGKVIWDPQQHGEDQKRHSIDVVIHPVREGAQPIKREILVESREWYNVVNPSLKALGVHPRTLNGRWCRAELVVSGTYEKAGEQRQLTTVKFLEFYADEAGCRAAAAAQYGTSPQAELPPTPPPPPLPTNGGNPTAANPERETAKKFLPALWKVAGHDEAKFAALLANTPTIAKWFTMESPEVRDLLLPF